MRRSTPVRALVAAALVSLPGVTMAHANAPDADPKHTNRLVDETSPYLLQHAHNPVDWRPWGEDAFDEARRRNVPIFLSIGYSTCYWCHVMERESFEDEATAAIMNERFVCVKVDREERPDVDDVYMASVQILTGRGGWPMSVFLTPPGARANDDPGLEPIYAGTYFPTPQFQSLLTNVSDAWSDRRPDILEQSAQITDALRQHFRAEAEPVRLDATPVGTAVSLLITRLYDEQHGGFGDAPKFPQPVYLDFLLDAADHIEDEAFSDRTHKAIRHTLDRMATGGMYDQVGGGFHRYSTDAQWLVPHFEKMLYDNGQLASVYAKAGRRYDDPYYRRIAAEVCEYVLAEMTDPDTGAFYSAQDAEVDHREGLNYQWTRAQFDEILEPDQATFAARIYGVDRGTNFQDPHHPDDPPANVLFLVDRPDRLATELEMSIEAFEEARRAVDARLLDARNRRKQPHRDDKTLVAWNGLMIRGMADAGRLLGEPRYVNAAGRAADFILDAMSDGDGGLLRAHRNGKARIPGFLEDYAMFIDGLISLHRAQQAMRAPDTRSLDAAIRLADAARTRFADPQTPGLWYDTLDGQTDLIIRSRSTYDGATPSGGSVMLNALISLNEITGDRRHLRHAIDLLGGLSRPIAESPVGPIDATRALHRILQLDSDLLSEFADQPDARERDLPVKVFASTERVGVGEGAPGELIVELRIDDDFHITSHNPGVEGLTPLAVNVTNGTGVQVNVDYPKGDALQGAAFADEAPLVHEGVVRLTIRIERSDEDWSGRPLLILTYHACTDEICLAPVTVELDVAIDRR